MKNNLILSSNHKSIQVSKTDNNNKLITKILTTQLTLEWLI